MQIILNRLNCFNLTLAHPISVDRFKLICVSVSDLYVCVVGSGNGIARSQIKGFQ